MNLSNRSTKLIWAIIIALALACLILACGCGRAGSAVIVAGSTSVQPYAEILEEEFALEHPGCEVDIQGGGTAAGITAVESGAAHIGMASRALKPDEQYLWSVEIAKDGLAIIVHPGNRLLDLTLEQIRGIYTGALANWSSLGGPNAKIHVITREEGSGTRDAFESLVMGQERISPKSIVQNSNGAVRQLVSNDPNSIGFISLGLVDENVKAIQLQGVAATWENVMDGSYTLFRPFLFVTDGPPAGQVEQFIAFTLSATGQQLLINEGLVPSNEGLDFSMEGVE
jgi:phosphate transport system substrate-binding protein